MAENREAPHTFTKQGVYYFCRRVPKDLQQHYKSPKISYSLRTKSPSVASSRALRAAQKLDEFWYHLRLKDSDLPGKNLLRMAQNVNAAPAAWSPIEVSPDTVKLSEAVGIYLRLKGQGRGVTFQRTTERCCGYVIDVCGDKDISAYTKSDANTFRDDLLKRELAGSSITRIIATVRSVINFAASEIGVELSNPFGKVYYDRTAGVEGREPIPLDTIRSLQGECRKLDDELRWIVALVSDTGLRLAEAVGLLKDDLRLEDEVPHVVVRQHPWRRLKTSGSSRKVPLVGTSLWAAHRIKDSSPDSPFAFPRYTTPDRANANSASAALNKWMKPKVPKNTTMHSFRHSLRDRLRVVECPADIVDQIGGWATEGVGHSYGSGYPLDVLHRWLRAVE